MHHYLYFVSVMFADHSALYAEKWSNRPHMASSCGSYHVGNENEELQSSKQAGPVKRIYVHTCTKRKKNNKKKITKKVAIYSRLSPASGESRLSIVIVQKKI